MKMTELLVLTNNVVAYDFLGGLVSPRIPFEILLVSHQQLSYRSLVDRYQHLIDSVVGIWQMKFCENVLGGNFQNGIYRLYKNAKEIKLI